MHAIRPIICAVSALAAAGIGAAAPAGPMPQKPPPSTSHVAVRSTDGDAWLLTWRDNATDETHFDVGMSATSLTGHIAAIGMAILPPDTESFLLQRPQMRAALGEPGCYAVTFYVFSVRDRDAWGLPGNTTVRMCVDDRRPYFPDVGDGRGATPAWWPAIPLAATALMCVAAGWALRLHR
jgi:hypothetical protein